MTDLRSPEPRRISAISAALAVLTAITCAPSAATTNDLRPKFASVVTTLVAAVPPKCKIGDVVTKLRGKDGRYAVLDTYHRLPSGWKPARLTWVNKTQQLQLPAASAWRKLRLAAASAGITINIVSAYRSGGYQETVFNRNVKKHGRAHALKYVARPGHSEHQLALTVDIGLGAGVALRSEPVAGKPATKAERAANWLHNNAATYGWVRSYPKGGLAATCYAPEPWHWRFIGVEEAEKFTASKLTLREYLWLKR